MTEIDAPDRYVLPEDEQERAAWRILNDDMATWAMRKLREAHRRREEIRRIAQAEIERIEMWADNVSRQPGRDIAYFEGLLGDYALRQRVETGDRRKSVSTPYGAIRTSRSKAAVEIVSQEELVAWAEEFAPELVRVAKSVLVSDLRKVVEATEEEKVVKPDTGEVVPGTAVRRENVSVTFDVDMEESE